MNLLRVTKGPWIGLVAAALLLWPAAACDHSVQGDAFDPSDLPGYDGDLDQPGLLPSDPGPDGGGPVTGPGAGLVGTWGQLLNVTVIQSGVPLIGSSWAAARNWYLVEVTTDSHGNLTATEKLCAVKIKLDTWVDRSIVPQAFVDHTATLVRHVTVESDAPGTPWISDQAIEVRGANLCNGACDPEWSTGCDRLPQASATQGPHDAPTCDQECTGSQCDQDQDGHPGMTMILSGMFNCELYVAQRWGSALFGEVSDEDTIAGAVVGYFSEQSLLASSSPFCQAGEAESVPEDCAEHQYFKMVRLPAGATCANVLELTDCDDDEETCDTNEVLPLDPNEDLPSDCS